MNNLKKGIVVLMVALASSSVFAKRIKIASIAPTNSDWDKDQKFIASEWKKITNGEIELQFIPGGEAKMVQSLKSARPGQQASISGGILTSLGADSLCPDSHLLTLCVPFMFRDQKEVNAVLDEFGPVMKKPFEDKGYVLLGFFNIGWAYFFTKYPTPTPAQLQKQRLSVGGMTSPMLANAFKSAGYLTIDVPGDKLLASMNTGDVEGVLVIPMYAYAAQYYKYLTNCLNAPLAPVMVVFLFSKTEWDSIPDKYKPELLNVIKRTEAKFVQNQIKSDLENLKLCEANGMKIFTPNEKELKVWRDEFSAKSKYMYAPAHPVADKGFYENIMAFLKKYRGE